MLPKILIASDHTGVSLKLLIRSYLLDLEYLVEDFGCDSEEFSVDYPDYAKKVAQKMLAEYSQDIFGILICGTGIGMSITANRYEHIRSAVCYNTEITKLARQHNDANVLCLGARCIDQINAKEIVYKFLTTKFIEERHKRRINKISRYKQDKIL